VTHDTILGPSDVIDIRPNWSASVFANLLTHLAHSSGIRDVVPRIVCSLTANFNTPPRDYESSEHAVSSSILKVECGQKIHASKKLGITIREQ
jgi:hypothetical protein